MTIEIEQEGLSLARLDAHTDAAVRQIPPLWPLPSYVAVNPFLGQSGESLAVAAARLGRVGGVPVTMDRDWYAQRIASGEITDSDLADALAAAPYAGKPEGVACLKRAAETPREVPQPLPTVADLAAEASGIDWPGLMADRIGAWAGGYFDLGQALWTAPQRRQAWPAYRTYAAHDITPEVMGLNGFATFVVDAPQRPREAIARAVQRLGLSEAALETYFHQLLLSLGGWAQYARQLLWQAELGGGTDPTAIDLLAIRLLWEEALFANDEAQIAEKWAEVRAAHEAPLAPGADGVIDEILQEAAERAAQRRLGEQLATPAAKNDGQAPLLQAAFCIDVRSEVFRRALEGVDPRIETLGFAGFFGMSAKHRDFASDVEELRLPALLNPGVTSNATAPEMASADRAKRYAARAKRAWGRFKLAAVSSFAFVEAMGPVYLVKLLADALGVPRHGDDKAPQPRFDPALDTASKTDIAATILRAMSLTEGFARVVLVAGHGANVVNNPHASGLHCGACGGYAGDVNARLLAALLNEREVRSGLAARGIAIPDETVFVAALHDTTTDTVHLYDRDVPTSGHKRDLETVRGWLATAGKMARGERALSLPRAGDETDIAKRAQDWSEVRPEWGLAGCRAFVAAPRRRTQGRRLEGRAFLHDYDWKQDSQNGFGVLELIMTAPVVVASWISLQYYGSTVAPETFGAGNKLLHNVVGGLGVLEGNGGTLRAGLPWQSVHDGTKYIHEPLRLSVCIEAPREAMTDILKRHPEVRALFDNRWLHLFALNENGRIAWRYAGNLTWQAETPEFLNEIQATALEERAAS